MRSLTIVFGPADRVARDELGNSLASIVVAVTCALSTAIRFARLTAGDNESGGVTKTCRCTGSSRPASSSRLGSERPESPVDASTTRRAGHELVSGRRAVEADAARSPAATTIAAHARPERCGLLTVELKVQFSSVNFSPSPPARPESACRRQVSQFSDCEKKTSGRIHHPGQGLTDVVSIPFDSRAMRHYRTRARPSWPTC